MQGFSVGEAAVAGLRLVFKRPGLLFAWAGFFVVASIVATIFVGIVLIATAGASLATMPTDAATMQAGDVGRILGAMAIPYALFILAMLLISTMLVTAVYRAILRPDERGFAYLKLGADEWRQLAVSLAIGIPLFGIYLAVAVAAGVLSQGGQGGLVGALVLLAALAGLVFVAVRFSLAGAQTFDRRRIDLLGAWALTKGRFWALFGTYLIASVLIVLILLVVVAAMMAAIGGTIGFTAFEALEANPGAAVGAAAGLIGIMLIFYFVVFPLFQIVAIAGSAGAPASVYKQIAQEGAEAVF